jgi:hypothetical protein
MKVYCNREILSALKDIKLPKSKSEILNIATSQKDISEAAIITLNQLEDKVYFSLDEICLNIKIVCSLELRNALKKIKFPVVKSDIIKYLKEKRYPEIIIETADELPEDITYNNVNEICE